jgi:hypothetical protein
MNRLALTAIAAGVALGALTTGANASSYTTDFENFALGGDTSGSNPLITDPALGANNWRGNGSSGLADNGVEGSTYDGEIVDTGGTHGKAYRLSNAKVSANYDTTHASTPTVTAIGETGSGGTPGSFSFQFDFKSASGALQEGLSIDITPFRSNTAARQGILRITDDETNGLSVGWWEVDNGSFKFDRIASGLSRSEWHSVSVDMTLLNGSNNDTVSGSVNSKTFNATTWESYTGYSSPKAIDSVVFRAVNPNDLPDNNTGGVAALDGGGVYFDNLSTTGNVVPVPSAVWGGMILLGGLGGFGAIRRKLPRA